MLPENENLLIAQVADMFAPTWQGKRKKWDFTVEFVGREHPDGAPDWVLYGHSTYERSSVLSGRPQRVYVWGFDEEEEAQAGVAALRKHFKRKFKCEFLSHSTRIPDDILLAGIPDDTDY